MSSAHMKNFKSKLKAMLVGSMALLFLTACTPPTEQERIDAVNKRIAPEGYITKTHLYIDWPALRQGEKVVAEPLKLKIPLEYLVPGIRLRPETPTESAELALSIYDHQITSIALTLQQGAKVHNPLPPGKGLTGDKAKRWIKFFNSAYSVIIERNHYFKIHNSRADLMSSVSIFVSPTHTREPDIDGLERYIQTKCYDFDEIERQVQTGLSPNELQRASDQVASKASDDHSPENCVEDRSYQYLVPPPEATPKDKNLRIVCMQTSCGGDFGIMGRSVSVAFDKLGGDTAYNFQKSFGNSAAGKKLFAEAKAAGKEVYATPQPRLDQVFSRLASWRDRLEPTRALLNSFIVNEIPTP